MEPVHEAGDVEEGKNGEDLAVRGGRDLLDLEALADDVLVGDCYGFGETCCSGAF